jgi:hypothetical protein
MQWARHRGCGVASATRGADAFAQRRAVVGTGRWGDVELALVTVNQEGRAAIQLHLLRWGRFGWWNWRNMEQNGYRILMYFADSCSTYHDFSVDVPETRAICRKEPDHPGSEPGLVFTIVYHCLPSYHSDNSSSSQASFMPASSKSETFPRLTRWVVEQLDWLQPWLPAVKLTTAVSVTAKGLTSHPWGIVFDHGTEEFDKDSRILHGKFISLTWNSILEYHRLSYRVYKVL